MLTKCDYVNTALSYRSTRRPKKEIVGQRQSRLCSNEVKHW